MAKSTVSPSALSALTSRVAALASAEFDASEAFDVLACDRDAQLLELVADINLPPAGVAATAEQIEQFSTIGSLYAEAWQARILGWNPSADKKLAGLAAAQQWLRVYKRAGIVKPQSAEAIKKQAVRAAKAEADKVNPKGAPKADEPASPAEGAKAAGVVLETLTNIEKHLLLALRAGQFAKAQNIVADMAKAA